MKNMILHQKMFKAQLLIIYESDLKLPPRSKQFYNGDSINQKKTRKKTWGRFHGEEENHT